VSFALVHREGCQTCEALPSLNTWHARSRAVILLEHAESICILGPVKPKNQLTRLAWIEEVVPVIVFLGIVSGSIANILVASSEIDPENTAVREPRRVSMGIPAAVKSVYVRT
jgi:hypothetical protein